jgi:hypothetical protein
MPSRFLFLVRTLLLALALAGMPALHAAPANNGAAKYAGTYYIFVINPQTFLQFAGTFKVGSGGNVSGQIFDSNVTVYPITGNIVNPATGTTLGRFAVDLVNGVYINTLTISLTATGQMVGRQETPGQFYTLSGAMYNAFFNQAGTYYGQIDGNSSAVPPTLPQRLIMSIGLQRRISGTFEQIPVGAGNVTYPVGNFTAVFGGANLGGLNGRSYLARTYFTDSTGWTLTYSTANPGTIPKQVTNANTTLVWRNNNGTVPYGEPGATGNLTVYRILPNSSNYSGNFTPNYPPFITTNTTM